MFGLRGRQIMMLLIVVALMFAASQYFPAFFAAFEFNDFVRQEVKYAASSRKTSDALREEVFRKGTDLGIPLTKKDIQIVRRGPAFTLEVAYSWPIDLKVYQHELTFRTSQTGEAFKNASN